MADRLESVWVTLLVFLDTGRSVRDGFLGCWETWNFPATFVTLREPRWCFSSQHSDRRWNMDAPLEPGTTINSENYIVTLQALKQRLRRIRRDKGNVLLQHDNARPHVSRATTEAIERLNLTTLTHPHLSTLQSKLVALRFPTSSEIVRRPSWTSLRTQWGSWEGCQNIWLRKQSVDVCRDGFTKVYHW